MNTSQIKNFAIQSRNILKAGVLNRILTLGFDKSGNLTVDRPVKIQGGTVFMDQLREESFYDAWIALETRLAKHGIKDVCEEAAYTWFNRLVAIRIMQKNHFIEPVMQYVSQETRIPVIVDQARSGRLSLRMTVEEKTKLDDLLRDSTKTNEQFNLLISAFCQANPVIFKCFGGIEKHISLLLPDNILSQGGFIDLLNNTSYLTDEDYLKSELIGWLYQFYISEKKDEVFAKKGKYDPDEIPAATQIFTPNWIVKYMTENTIGRIYLDNNPYADEIKVGMKYLVEPAEPTPEDAILKLDDLSDYKMIDNACGSGHILIEGFNLFYKMYMYEGYATRTAIENILTKNIIGIDLDTRAKQLATFALLMTAARLDKSFLDCKVMPRVLDFPEPFNYPGGTIEEFFSHYYLGCSKKVIDETIDSFELMKKAEHLGSIMKFNISPETRAAMENSTSEWKKREFINSEIAEAVKTMDIILALTDKYTAVCANPPYMGNGSMNETLLSYVTLNYSAGKQDLCTVFIQVFKQLCASKGNYAFITPPSWPFLSSFEALRRGIVEEQSILSFLHLSRGVFGADFGSVAVSISNQYRVSSTGVYFRLVERTFQEFEQSHLRELFEATLSNHDFKFYFKGYTKDIERICYSDNGNRVFFPNVKQDTFNKIPNLRFGYWLNDTLVNKFENALLKDVSAPKAGLSTADNNRFLRLWHEVEFDNIYFNGEKRDDLKLFSEKWVPMTKGGSFRRWYGNNEYVLNFKDDGEELKYWLTHNPKDPSTTSYSRYIRNYESYCQSGFSFSDVCSGHPNFRFQPQGFIPNSRGPFIYSSNLSLLGYLNSKLPEEYLSVLAPTMTFNVGDIALIPYIETDDDVVNRSVKENISISKADWDAHETSWDFKKNELLRAQRLCGQNCAELDMLDEVEIKELKESVPFDGCKIAQCIRAYKSEWERKFRLLHYNEEKLNCQFIEIYGLQQELVPSVPLDEITILQQGEICIKNDQIVWNDDVIIKQFISYAIGCWMGRYRLDHEGLYIAHYPTEDEVCTYDYNGQEFEIDDDAIIPLMGTNNPFEDDNALQKLINFIKIVFGENTLTENLNHIEHCLGKSLENYLIKDFWKDHKKMYQNRPIYWLFSSSKGAFQVLTYMHRMNPYTAEKIRTKYLLPYIDYLKGRIEVDEARGAELSSVERQNLAKMKVALDECNEYHDRLHEVAIKAIDFDLDDGVVVNYAKFGDVLAKIK